MKKKQLEAEIDSIMQEATTLQKEAELEMSTADFLRNEAKKLMKKIDSDGVSFEEKEQIYKQMLSLQGRLESEIRAFNKNMPKLSNLEKKLNNLKHQMVEE